MLYEGKYNLKANLLSEQNDVQPRVKSGTVAENLARIHFGMDLLGVNVGPGEADLPTGEGTYECKSGSLIAAEITNAAPHGAEMKALARSFGGKAAGAQKAINKGWAQMKDAEGNPAYKSEADYLQKVASWYVGTKSADGVILVSNAPQVVRLLVSEFGPNARKTATKEQLEEKAAAAGCVVSLAEFVPEKLDVVRVSSYGETRRGTRIKLDIRPKGAKILKKF